MGSPEVPGKNLDLKPLQLDRRGKRLSVVESLTVAGRGSQHVAVSR